EGGGHGGPARPGVPQAHAGHGHLAAGRRQGRARARLDADLPPDGGGAILPAGGVVSGAEPLVTADRRSGVILAVGGVLLALVPPIAALTDQPFYLDL